MSWRTVIISSTAKLDYQMGYLVIRKDDVTKIHLSEIENVSAIIAYVETGMNI